MIPIIWISRVHWGQFFDAVTRRDALLDLLLINKQAATSNVIVNSKLACRDHEMVEFKDIKGRQISK